MCVYTSGLLDKAMSAATGVAVDSWLGLPGYSRRDSPEVFAGAVHVLSWASRLEKRMHQVRSHLILACVRVPCLRAASVIVIV